MDKDTIDHILNVLRRGTVTWSGRSKCLRAARKRVLDGTYKNGRPRSKFHYQCSECKTWFRSSDSLEVDHIIEVGPFTGSFDDFINRLFCGQENLQALCSVCHQKKTSGYNASRRFERKNGGKDVVLD